MPYLLLGLQDVQWAVENSRGARKLARTPHVNQKKKKTKTRKLNNLLSKAPKGNNNKVKDAEFFIKQYRDYYADIEKENECLEAQLQVMEKKLKLDLMLMDLNLADSSKRASKMRMLEEVHRHKTELKVSKKLLQAHKTLYEYQLLGAKGLISNDVGALDSPSAGRILHRSVISSVPLFMFSLSSNNDEYIANVLHHPIYEN
jgi:hypothetical protein